MRLAVLAAPLILTSCASEQPWGATIVADEGRLLRDGAIDEERLLVVRVAGVHPRRILGETLQLGDGDHCVLTEFVGWDSADDQLAIFSGLDRAGAIHFFARASALGFGGLVDGESFHWHTSPTRIAFGSSYLEPQTTLPLAIVLAESAEHVLVLNPNADLTRGIRDGDLALPVDDPGVSLATARIDPSQQGCSVSGVPLGVFTWQCGPFALYRKRPREEESLRFEVRVSCDFGLSEPTQTTELLRSRATVAWSQPMRLEALAQCIARALAVSELAAATKSLEAEFSFAEGPDESFSLSGPGHREHFAALGREIAERALAIERRPTTFRLRLHL